MSVKLTVIMRTKCLNIDSAIRTITIMTASPADAAGRRSSMIQKALSMPQARRNAAFPIRSGSDQSIRNSAHSCSTARMTIASARRSRDGVIVEPKLIIFNDSPAARLAQPFLAQQFLAQQERPVAERSGAREASP